ncbi:mitochondrial thiamine pyrophosphate transporter, variant 2 [Balamuthia mandrillaris]
MLLLAVQATLWAFVLGRKHFFSIRGNLWHLLQCLLICWVTIETIVLLIVLPSTRHKSNKSKDGYLVLIHFSPFLLPLLFSIYFAPVRRSVKNIVALLVQMRDMAVLMSFSILLASWLGWTLFKVIDEEHFGSLGDSMAQMVYLLYAGNLPGMLATSFEAYRISALFFASFIAFVKLLFLSLALAVVYSCYSSLMRADVNVFLVCLFTYYSFSNIFQQHYQQKERRRVALLAAYDVLKELTKREDVTHEESGVSFPVLRRLFVELNAYHHLSHVPMDQLDLVCKFLDANRNSHVGKDGFLELCYVFNLRFRQRKDKKEARGLLAGVWPGLYRARGIRVLTRVERSPLLEYVVDGMVLISTLCSVIESIQFPRHRVEWEIVQMVFVGFYTFELFLKIFIRGFDCFHGQLHRLDFISILSILVLYTIVASTSASLYSFAHSSPALFGLLIVFRSLRLLRLLRHLPILRGATEALTRYLPMLFVLMSIFLLLGYFFFAALGILLFGGKVYPENPRLKDTNFAKAHLFSLNFNDFGDALFALMTVQLAADGTSIEGWVASSGSEWTHIYFVCFLIVSDMLLMNIVLASVLEAYEHYSSAKANVQRRMTQYKQRIEEKKGDGGRGRKTKIQETTVVEEKPMQREYYGVFDLDALYSRKMKTMKRSKKFKRGIAKPSLIQRKKNKKTEEEEEELKTEIVEEEEEEEEESIDISSEDEMEAANLEAQKKALEEIIEEAGLEEEMKERLMESVQRLQQLSHNPQSENEHI